MTRKVVAFLTALLLVFGAVFAAPALAFHAIQDEGKGTVSLDRADGAKRVPEQASGVATFRIRPSSQGFYNVRVRMEIGSLPERAGRVYEVWLVEDETGEELNLGAFDTDNDGDGEISVTRTINNLAQFDRIIVTTEDINDLDPRRDGPVVLEGEQG